jgi:glycosyltransferase involved in cell wall biosynthesis
MSGGAPGRVLLVAPSPPPYGGMALQARLLEKLLQRDGADVVFLASNFALPGWFGALARIPGVRTGLRALLIWPKLWRLMPQVGVVHVMAASWLYFFVVVCPVVVVGRIHGKRIVLNYRGGGARQFFGWFGLILAPFFRAASVVTAPSEFLAEAIRHSFRIAVAIVPNILDLSLFRFRQRTAARPKLLVTRHLEKIYDLETVLRAFQVVERRHPEATLWIGGTGSEEKSLQRLAAALGLQNVRFLGAIPHNDLPAIYDQCDIFINASRVDNFPGALLEASASGLPVVSSCAGGIPFIYQNDKNALLRQPGDWQGLADAVEEVLQSPSLATRLSQEGATLSQSCEWPEVRRSLYRAYGMAIEDGAAQTVGVG